MISLCKVKFYDEINKKEDAKQEFLRLHYGFGFYLTNIDRDKLKEFILKYDKLQQEELDLNQYDMKNIALRLKERTHLEFSYYKDNDNSGIILETNKINSMIKETVERYAKELGVKQYGKIHFAIKEKLIEDELYDVDE